MRHFYPLFALADGQVNTAGGDSAAALEHLARGEQLALDMRMRPMALMAQLGAAQILAASDRSGEAAVKRGEARAVIEETGSV